MSLVSNVANTQEPQWITFDLGKERAATGAIAIGDDGTIAWAQAEDSITQVFRRRKGGVTDVVIEFDSADGTVWLPAVMDDGTVISTLRDPNSGQVVLYADGLLVYPDTNLFVQNGPTSFVTLLWSGTRYGQIAEYDVATGQQSIRSLPDILEIDRLLDATEDGAVFLSAIGTDPADSGFYFWDDGVLTKEPLADPTDFIPDWDWQEEVIEESTGRAGRSASISGNKLAYLYRVTLRPLDEESAIFVVRDLATDEIEVFSEYDWFPYSIIGWVRVDDAGRVYYRERIDPDEWLVYRENGVKSTISTRTDGSFIVNSSGRSVTATNIWECEISDPTNMLCTSDVILFDANAGTTEQLTLNERGTYITNLDFNEQDDIAYSYTYLQDTLTEDNRSVPFSEWQYSVSAVFRDAEPPAEPSSPAAASNSQTSIELTWGDSTDDVAIEAYEIFRDDVLITTTSDTRYQDSGLEPGTSYEYRIEAIDFAGNRTASAPVSLSTQAPPLLSQPSSGGSGSIGVLMLVGLSTQLLWRRRRTQQLERPALSG